MDINIVLTPIGTYLIFFGPLKSCLDDVVIDFLCLDQSKQHFYQCISLLPAVRTLNVAPTTVYNKDGLNKTKKTADFHLQVA